MLWVLCAMFLGLWLVTMALSMTFGGLAHLLLIAAIALLLIAARRDRTPI